GCRAGAGRGRESCSPTPRPPGTPGGSCRRRRVVPRHRRERSIDRPLADGQRHGGKPRDVPPPITSPAHERSMQKIKSGASVSSAHGTYGHRGATLGSLKAPSSRRGECAAPVEVDGRSGAEKSEAPRARSTPGLRLTRLKRAALA